MKCSECKGSGLPTRKHSDLSNKCEDCGGTGQVNEEMEELVNKFLSWPLPLSVCSDSCVTMMDYPTRWGTNLLTATETEQMLNYVVGSLLQENEELKDIRDQCCREIVEATAELIYLRKYGKDGAIWEANENKEVWLEMARKGLSK